MIGLEQVDWSQTYLWRRTVGLEREVGVVVVLGQVDWSHTDEERRTVGLEREVGAVGELV